MNSQYNRIVMFIVALLFAANNLFAQAGATTAAMNGEIVDQNGDALPGANIIAVHEPSGTQYGTTSRADGKFNLLGVRVGGPYTVTASFVGYQSQKQENINLALSQNFRINFILPEEAFELEGVTITAERGAILSEARTGAAQNVSSKNIESLPTVSRSFQSFAKLSPQFDGTSSSAAGRNNRYNNIQIDGTQYNDLFGLGSSGTPGGQASANPISLDAISEFQVVTAPYDVRLGSFTGAGINAVTRSGTNKWEGSIFYYGRNEGLVGDAGWIDDEEDAKFNDFKEFQSGFRVGGPIQKDKLFFFVSGEITENDQPVRNDALSGSNAARNQALMDRFGSILRGYGMNPGTSAEFTRQRPSTKLFARVDYNINKSNHLTLRHNYVDAESDIMNNRSGTWRAAFSSHAYRFQSETNSTVLQLNSTIGNNMSNELILGLTTIRDKRAGITEDRPEIEIEREAIQMRAGPDRFSSANALDQDIFEITNNFTYLTGDHVLTFGTHNEFFSFKNLFIRSFFGYYEFRTLDDLEAGVARSYQRAFSRTSDPQQAAEFSVNQFGFYVQDEWRVSDRFKLTAGLRIDIPFLPDTPERNDSLTAYFPSLSTDNVPDGNLLFSPRLGFNYDLTGDRSTQLRGGIGIFTGRIPYVWMSNNYGNTGTLYAEVRGGGADLEFTVDPNRIPGVGSPGTGAPSFRSEVDLVDPDFKLPQVMRFNLAVDHQLPMGFVGTAEFQYSKSVNDLVYEKLNLNPQVSTSPIENRPIYGGTNSGNGNFFDVLNLTNTDDAFSYTLSFQVQRYVPLGLSVNAAYTYGVSEDVNSVTSSQARSQMRYNPIFADPNNPEKTRSAFDLGHRIFTSLTYTQEFFKDAPTSFSVFYNGQSGGRISFTVDGDVNRDGFDSNDLFYIPANRNEILLGEIDNGAYVADEEMYTNLFGFIANNEYLNDNKGSVAERNGSRDPWQDVFDVRVAQVVPDFLGLGEFQFTLDILNFLNLIDSEKGHIQNTSFGALEIVDYEGTDPATGRPVYSYGGDADDTPWSESDVSSRYRIQLGIRYTLR